MTPAISRSREPAVLAYLTRQRSWMLTERAFGQLASTCLRCGSVASPYFSHEPGDVVATAPAAGLALDRSRDGKVRQLVGVVSHTLKNWKVRWDWPSEGRKRVTQRKQVEIKAIGFEGELVQPFG